MSTPAAARTGEEDDQRSTRRLVSAGAIMAAGTATSRLVGFVRVALLAYVLGNATRQGDMFSIANSVPNMIYILLAGGVLNTVFVPQVVRAMKHDPDGGEAYTNRLMTAGLLGLGVITVITTVGAPVIIWIYSNPGWKSAALAPQYDSMVLVAYLCLPQIFFYGANVLIGQVLNARNTFGPMMFSPIANNLIAVAVLVAYLIAWPDRNNAGAFTTGQALVLGLGSTLGIVAQAAVLVPFLRRAGFRFRPRFDFRHTGLGKTAGLAKWTLGFVLVAQLAVVVVTNVASGATVGGRGAGWLVYSNAYLLWILPHSLITVSLATAMLPSASAMAATGNLTGVRAEVERTIRLAVTALLPAALGYLVVAQPITRLLFGNGRGVADSPLVGYALTTLAVGLVPFTVQYVCLRAFYSLEDTRTPFFIQLVIAAVNIGLALAFTLPVGRPDLVAAGLGLAYSMSYLVGLTVSFRRLRRRLPGLDGRRLLRHGVRVLLAAVPAAAGAYLVTWAVGGTGRLVQLVGLGLAGLVAIILYVVGARLLHLTEVEQILGPILRRLPGGRRSAATPSAPQTSQIHNIGGDSHQDPAPAAPTIEQTGAMPPPTTVTGFDLAQVTGTVEESPGMTDLDVREWGVSPAPADPTTGPTARPTAGPTAGGPDFDDDHTTVRTSTAPRLPAGTILVDRYRLEEILAFSEPTVTWRAFDQTLSRSVLVHLLPSSDERAPRLLAAARRAAGATDSRYLRVLDAVEGARLGDGDQGGTDTGPTSYIVCEYATGQSLEAMLADGGPLTGLEAAWLVREVADALAGVHAAGLHHGRLSPDTVIITPSGNVKIVGLLIEQAMRPASSHAPLPGGGRLDVPVAEADLLDLGRLLYAALVGRWPGGPAYGLPDAPADGDHWLSLRQIRAGVPPAMDRICEQVLGRPPRHHLTPITTTAELVAALSRTLGPADAAGDLERRLRQQIPQVPGTDRPVRTWAVATPAARAASGDDTDATMTRAVGSGPATEPLRAVGAAVGTVPVRRAAPASPTTPVRGPRPATASGPGRQPRRWIAVLIALLVLIVVAALVVALNPDRLRSALPSAGPSTAAPTTAGAAGGPLRIVAARDFDPQGTDANPPRENAAQVPRAIDGDPATRWTTVSYRGNPQLGGLKRGVGLVLDLGSPQSVAAVDLRLSGTGTALQIRVPQGDAAAVSSPDLTTDATWRTVGSAAQAGSTTTVTLDAPVTTRYVLVYLTSLPREGSGYRGGIYEVQVRA